MYKLNKRIKYSKDEQYKIIGDRAYTEDNILINNIFISNLPEDATIQQALEYFQKFGDVRLEENDENHIICFTDPKVAAEVLQRTDHSLMNCPINVHPCESCHQPDVRNAYEPLMNTNATILDLNDDCLLNICNKLTSKDLINVALTCERFAEIMKMILKQYKELIIEQESYTTDEEFYCSPEFLSNDLHRSSKLNTNIYFRTMVPEIKLFRVNNLELLKQILFCSRIEKLVIDSCIHPLLWNIVNDLIDKMPLLNELDLIRVRLPNYLMKKISTFQKLKFLYIRHSSLTGKNFHIDGLEKLSLESCRNVEYRYYAIFCENHKKLHYLDIANTKILNTKDLEQPLKHLKKLKTLKISNYGDNINSIAQLPNLKHLKIRGTSKIDLPNDFIKELVKYKADQLEELELIQFENMSAEDISLIAELKKLKVLSFFYQTTFKDAYLEKLSQLTELEVFTLGCSEMQNISEKSIIIFLSNCLNLKKINFQFYELTNDTVRHASELVRKQRIASLRRAPVNLLLEYMNNYHFHSNNILLGKSDSSDDDNDSDSSGVRSYVV